MQGIAFPGRRGSHEETEAQENVGRLSEGRRLHLRRSNQLIKWIKLKNYAGVPKRSKGLEYLNHGFGMAKFRYGQVQVLAEKPWKCLVL
jgi:hypothetical protein